MPSMLGARLCLLLALWGLALPTMRAAELPEVRELLRHGEYDRVIGEAVAGAQREPGEQGWGLLRGEALLQRGRYAEARTLLEELLVAFPNSLRARLLAHEVFRASGAPEKARLLLEEMDRLGARSWLFQEPLDRVALGQAALLVQADPRKVMEAFFTPLKKAHPELREAFLASGELALTKSDYALAAKMFGEAAQKFPEDPDAQFGLARAYQPSDPEAMRKALEATLRGNPHHVGAQLLAAEYHIDAEHPEEAAAALRAALETNPQRPEAHALRAVQAELAGNAGAFAEARAAALRPWPQNPQVEYLIGRKLSQKYRFAEGAAHQRKALEWEPTFLAARLQLAQDLLRLSHEDEGWKLAQEVRDADPYDVVAYNLATLQERLATFTTLPSEHFLVRMDPHEAAIYGARVLALLERAYAQVGPKYGLDPKQRTTVEIFPEQKDFAIRTFGLPGGQGYLGVCFGNVITALSPAALPGSANNWEAVLWHEFTHVVTLGLTKNRMPRWFSEGISVYEERQAHGNWGEQMKPRYRAMILGADLVPLSQLSGAFLQPKTPAHLQFAYYESSLAIEFLLERFGLPAMKSVFADLARGISLNAALTKHAAPIETLDRDFAEHVQQLARGVAPKLDWTALPSQVIGDRQKYAEWLAAHPTNYYALKERAGLLMRAQDWPAAREVLQQLVELYPDQHEPDGAYALLAQVQRAQGEKDAELATLTKLVGLAADAPEALQRLLEIHAERAQWSQVATVAEQLIAISPLSPVAYRQLARSWQALGQPAKAIAAYQTLLQVETGPTSDAHYQLATLLRQVNQRAAAKRHVLQALEEAPRYRDALHLLVELSGPAAR